MPDVKVQKRLLRKQILEMRDAVTEDMLKSAGVRLKDIIVADRLYASSDTVLAYASYGSELPTYPFICKAIEDGRKVYLPKVIGTDMIFYRIHSVDNLCAGYKSIPEPVISDDFYVYDKEMAENVMLLMPGVVFDYDGNRIGYGGGFYDRFLENKPELIDRSVACAFYFQKIDSVPFEEFDLKPGRIIYISER